MDLRLMSPSLQKLPRTIHGVAATSLREKVAFLSDPGHYRGPPHEVVPIETHFSWVFLAGHFAYKLKKPVRQTRMDHRTLARRERACRAELRLNRRLAPEVYRRVLPLARQARPGGRSAHARTVDWLIEMVRLPAERMLDRAIQDGTLRRRDLDHVMDCLARFYRRARREPLSDAAYLARLRRQTRETARELRAADLALDPARVEKLIAAEEEFLSRHRRVLAGRGARLLDGHGDLRPEHVFLGAPGLAACVIDCVEFDDDLRHLDPAEEVAFLALECARLGAESLSAALPERYVHATGDAVPPAVVHFYMGRRAAVRAKIAAWHLRDAALARQHGKWRIRAHSYLDDALCHLHRACELATDSVPAPRVRRRLARVLVAAAAGIGMLLSNASGLHFQDSARGWPGTAITPGTGPGASVTPAARPATA